VDAAPRMRLADCLHWLQSVEDTLLYTPDEGTRGTLGAGQGAAYPPPLAYSRWPYYRLDGQTPVRVPDIVTWDRWFTTADRQVRDTWLVARTTRQAVRVSTVFLGMDHQWAREGPPLLFETMVSEAALDLRERCSTWAEAEAQHAAVCALVRTWLDQPGTPDLHRHRQQTRRSSMDASGQPSW
jgi:hypothetical protein